jgi:hypothetical protein
MRKLVMFLTLVLFLEIFGVLGFSQTQSYLPENGFVPNDRTAIAIADVVLVEIYGEKQINEERPFSAKLEHEVWVVRGTLHTPNGGVAEIRISKRDGCILHVTHGK